MSKVIAYASRTLTKAEKIIPPQKMSCHRMGYQQISADPSGRLARWALRLQEHDFDVKYKTGKHSDADALSRNPVEEETETSDKFCSRQYEPCDGTEKGSRPLKLKLLSNSSKTKIQIYRRYPLRKNFDQMENCGCQST
ncbi:transposon Ty3-I Gag-Pol polyprotein [Trichonephila clavipes]|nr:transposon Ty3-I Gag-Pol polyprotein [Trichonephila clavipes]